MSAPTLAGLTVGITADRRADEQAQMLQQRGASVIHAPTIRTRPIDDDGPARLATEALVAGRPDVVVVTTAVGVRAWLALADGWGIGDDLADLIRGAYVAARGAKAAAALSAAGLDVDWRAPTSRLSEVVDHLVARGVSGQRVALQLDGSGRPRGIDALIAGGADVVPVPTYIWTRPDDSGPALRLIDAACSRRVDAVTFTAAPAVHNLFGLAEEKGLAGELRDAFNGPVVAMCIGPVCGAAAASHGVQAAREPSVARLGSMVKALTDELEQQRRVVDVGGHRIALQGAMVVAADARAVLPARERAVLEVLARRPDAVVSRRVLLADVWGTIAIDPHALEAVISRLRRRLAPTGVTVEAVPRRGYRLTSSR